MTVDVHSNKEKFKPDVHYQKNPFYVHRTKLAHKTNFLERHDKSWKLLFVLEYLFKLLYLFLKKTVK